jgi:hydrogenase/urease accessory protein HupE
MFSRICLVCLFALIIGQLASKASAHDSRPLFIQITEMDADNIRIEWKIPPSLSAVQTPRITLAPPCKTLINPSTYPARNSEAYTCPQGLSSKSVFITYPNYNPSLSTLIRVNFKTKETRTTVLSPDINEWQIPAQESFSGVIRTYFGLGIKHILSGLDHLLFIVALIYIARRPKRILVTLTGFTIAHSITVFLVALNIVHVSVIAIEVIIALSIIFLAREIAGNNQSSLTWRHPVLIAGGFGLVHGGGFASALTELGLPQTEKINGLLFFNLGIEAGQILVVFILLFLWLVLSFLGQRIKFKKHRIHSILGYSLGVIATYWLLVRISIYY